LHSILSDSPSLSLLSNAFGVVRRSLSSLKETTKQIRQTWDGVRPEVESRGGAVESKAFELLVTQLEGTSTIAEYGRIATSILGEVDRLEAVFTRNLG